MNESLLLRPSYSNDRRIIQNGKSHSLHQLISSLQRNPGIDDFVLGIIYAAVVLNQPRENYRIAGNEREAKRRVQEYTRGSFYWLQKRISSETEVHPIQEYFMAKLAASDPNFAVLVSHGLERKVLELRDDHHAMNKIADAVKNGSKEFYEDHFSHGRDKRFLEYNRILAHLGRID